LPSSCTLAGSKAAVFQTAAPLQLVRRLFETNQMADPSQEADIAAAITAAASQLLATLQLVRQLLLRSFSGSNYVAAFQKLLLVV
jgi:hypothetical protein